MGDALMPYPSAFACAGMDHFMDVTNVQAEAVAKYLITAGTSFACTSEPWDGRRRFYLSESSVRALQPLLGLMLVRGGREDLGDNDARTPPGS